MRAKVASSTSGKAIRKAATTCAQGEDRQRRNSSSPKAAATTTPVTNHESGIAKLIKRPLRWLKALGKK